MEYHIIVNSNIYKTYKSEVINLNLRLFCDDYFSNIKNYNIPIDLLGIIDYLPYCDSIFIDSTTTFQDYINILLVLDFLYDHNYENNVLINYYNIHEKNYKKAIFTTIKLKRNDYKDVNLLVKSIKENLPMDKIILQIPGAINFINFYNTLVDRELFNELIADDIEQFDGDIDEITSYLENRFSQFNLSKNFYKNYLKKG